MQSNVENTVLLAESLNQVSFKVPEYDALLAMVQQQHESVAVRVDDTCDWGHGNRQKVRGIIVKGHHFAGKTDLVGQCLEAVEPMVSGDGQTVEPHTRMIEAPHNFTQAGQARNILAAMGYPLTRKMTPDLAWFKVGERLATSTITQLAIDNWHWSFAPARAGKLTRQAEKRQIQAAYTHLLDHVTWPLALIFVALPEVDEELAVDGMHHIRDRCDHITIGRMSNDDLERINLRRGIEELCKKANLQLVVFEEDKFFHRLIHAADEARGLAITLSKLAVLDAVRNGGSRLEIQHFRDVYGRMTGTSDEEANPFVSAHWAGIDTSTVGKDSDVIDKLRAMNRPAKSPAAGR